MREVPGRGICAVAFSSNRTSATPWDRGERREPRGWSQRRCALARLKRKSRGGRTSSSISMSSIQFLRVSARHLRYHTAFHGRGDVDEGRVGSVSRRAVAGVGVGSHPGRRPTVQRVSSP